MLLKMVLNGLYTHPLNFELYPNMCVDSYSYNSKKRALAKDLGEITMLWNCAPKNRQKAFDNEITSWKDPNCSSEIFGHWGHQRYNN